jgi:tRNA (cytidine/uridine-2'-O-)-methyltransferase
MDTVQPPRCYALTTKGVKNHTQVGFKKGDAIVMGPETRGLPDEILDSLEQDEKIRIPMFGNSRSLNLSNATAIIVYEAWRQLDFEGAG